MADLADGPGPARLALIGAGQRGTEVYGAFAPAHPDLVRFVAVGDPDPARRDARRQTVRRPPISLPVSLDSQRMVFPAERARKERAVVRL